MDSNCVDENIIKEIVLGITETEEEENLEEKVVEEVIELIDHDYEDYMTLFSRGQEYDSSGIPYITEIVSAYNGHMHVSNLSAYEPDDLSTSASLGIEIDQVDEPDSEDIRNLATITTINASQGQFMYRDVSMEMKDKFNHWILNPNNKIHYQIHLALIGIGTALMKLRSPTNAGGRFAMRSE